MLAILIGLIPATLIRWVIFRRRLTFGPALAASFVIGLSLLGLWQALGEKHPATTGAAAVLSFCIFRSRSSKDPETKSLNAVLPGMQFKKDMFKINLHARRDVIIAAILLGLLGCVIILGGGNLFASFWR